jgi:hypothetical protein
MQSGMKAQSVFCILTKVCRVLAVEIKTLIESEQIGSFVRKKGLI